MGVSSYARQCQQLLFQTDYSVAPQRVNTISRNGQLLVHHVSTAARRVLPEISRPMDYRGQEVSGTKQGSCCTIATGRTL